MTAFSQFNLIDPLTHALNKVGYETPTPIQAQTIPFLLSGRDLLGQAQTGTGKTAAFALPILNNLNLREKDPQVLVLTPTRELAIQVAEAFQTYAAKLKNFHVLPLYGGQEYRGQLHALKRGVHVVVGTPGRVMDHIKRGTLKFDSLTTFVLDEADEMLRMGFIDDVDWILSKAPSSIQLALFSATMPKPIRRIANKYLNNPAEVTIKLKSATAETIQQRYWQVSGNQKLDALTRILEAEPFEAMLVFVRTKSSTEAISEKLSARGYASAPLSGDIAQNQRERTVKQLKSGKLDIIVATDVAARGLDVERISHVLNYDIPHDTEAYIHRIGRTGRAGRKGEAILFVTPREKRLLHAIERATNTRIEKMVLPSNDVINQRRVERFKQQITDHMETDDMNVFTDLVRTYQKEHDISMDKIAASLAQMAQGDGPFLLKQYASYDSDSTSDSSKRKSTRKAAAREFDEKRDRKATKASSKSYQKFAKNTHEKTSRASQSMQRYRIEVGHIHEVKPGNIVGAIANEAGLRSPQIGRIEIRDQYSIVRNIVVEHVAYTLDV